MFFKILFLLVFTNITFAKTLTVCHKGAFDTLDPHIANNTASIDSTFLKIYEPLVKRVGDNSTIIPLLVKDWKSTSDYRIWSFELRENIAFHSNKYFVPKRVLEAQDIEFSFKRSKERNKDLNIKRFIIKDKYKFSIELERPQKNFLSSLIGPEYSIMSKEYFMFMQKTKNLKYFTLLPIGNGPFKIDNFKPQHIKLSAFKHYHLGELLYDKLEFLSINFNKTRMDMLKMDECDISSKFSFDQIIDLNSGKKYELIPKELKSSIYMAISKKTNQKINIAQMVKKLNFQEIDNYYETFTWKDESHVRKLHKKRMNLIFLPNKKHLHLYKLKQMLKKEFDNYEISLKEVEVTSLSAFLKNPLPDTIALFISKNTTQLKSNKVIFKKLASIKDYYVLNKKIKSFFPQDQKAQDYSTIYIK